jgi:hypothetical protein
MRELNASIPVLFINDKFFVDMNDATWDVNEFEVVCDRRIVDESDWFISSPDKSSSLARRKCHFEY